MRSVPRNRGPGGEGLGAWQYVRAIPLKNVGWGKTPQPKKSGAGGVREKNSGGREGINFFPIQGDGGPNKKNLGVGSLRNWCIYPILQYFCQHFLN